MLRGQLRFFREAGFEVYVASSPGGGLNRVAVSDGVTAFAIPMEREMAPLRDVVSLWRLWRLMRRLRPDICHVGTPKAGLLGGLAALLAGVPRRFYTLHGLRLETTIGWKRALLTAAELISCLLAQRVICVSGSLREKAVELGVVPASKTRLIGSGSANGVDVSRFHPTALRQDGARSVRRNLGLPERASVVGFCRPNHSGQRYRGVDRGVSTARRPLFRTQTVARRLLREVQSIAGVGRDVNSSEPADRSYRLRRRPVPALPVDGRCGPA